MEKITANKNSKKYRGQQKAHLITNQKAVDVDISNDVLVEKDDDILNGEADETIRLGCKNIFLSQKLPF